MEIIEELISGWPGYRLSSGDVSVGLTPCIGGRIMSFIYRGEELLYAHAPESGKTYDFSSIPDILSFKKGFGFRLFGGDKTWVAPECAWYDRIPPLEIDAGAYAFEMKGATAVMTSPVCRETGIQIVRQVSMGDDGEMRLIEEFLNTTSLEIVRGIWNVTQVKKPFDVYLPSVLADVRSYHYQDPTLPDPRMAPVQIGEWVKIPVSGQTCFKFGAMLREGRAVLVRDAEQGPIALMKSFEIAPDQPYAHGSMVEVFNSSAFEYGEIEVHSPLYTIPAGSRVRLVQRWQVGPARELFPCGD